MSLHEERVNYGTIKAWVLEAYYDFCRDRGLGAGWAHDGVMGAVEYEYECAFERPVENVMLKVIELVLSGGWHKEAEQNIRRTIADQLAEHGLENLLADVPAGEAEAFRHDLRILKLIEE
jgi:hypothetical protein